MNEDNLKDGDVTTLVRKLNRLQRWNYHEVIRQRDRKNVYLEDWVYNVCESAREELLDALIMTDDGKERICEEVVNGLNISQIPAKGHGNIIQIGNRVTDLIYFSVCPKNSPDFIRAHVEYQDYELSVSDFLFVVQLPNPAVYDEIYYPFVMVNFAPGWEMCYVSRGILGRSRFKEE